jgi:hypothetical protein
VYPQQPPPYGYPPPYPYSDPHDYYVVGQDDQPGWVHRPESENPQAITGFSFGICALGLFVLSGGIAFLVAIPCSIVGIVLGRRGMKAVDEGRATKHRRYAKAGFVNGIVTLCLASFMALSLLLAAIFPEEFEEDGSEFGAVPLIRAVEHLVAFATGG